MVLLWPQARRCTSVSRSRDDQLPNAIACQSNLLGEDAHQESKTRADSSSWWAGESLALMGLILSCAVLTAYTAKECMLWSIHCPDWLSIIFWPLKVRTLPLQISKGGTVCFVSLAYSLSSDGIHILLVRTAFSFPTQRAQHGSTESDFTPALYSWLFL